MKGNVCICLVVFLLALLFVSCNDARKQTLDRLVATESNDADGGVSDARIEELKEGIRKFSAEVESHVKAADNLGQYYKMLGMAYMEREMYELAFDAFVEALEIKPTDPYLLTQAAIAKGWSAKYAVDGRLRNEYLQIAERYYQKALQADPGYEEALYGVSVLYIYELEQPLEAESYLKRLLEDESRHVEAMFLLARVYVVKGEYRKAVDLYRKIEEISKVEEKVQAARENRRMVEGYLR